MNQQAQRINLSTLIRQITDLQRPIEPPTFISGIVHPDYLIIYWQEPKRTSWGSFPFKIPQVTNTCIEYKSMVDSEWTKIKTNSETTTACCFYKKNPIHQFSQSHQVWNYFWNEYNAFEEDVYYDVRVCFENNHETKHWTTLSSLGIPSLPPSFNFRGFLSNDIENPIQNQCYLVLENDSEIWTTYKNCIALYSANRGIEGWVIYYPRKGWKIDNFYYDGEEWIDLKLKTSMSNLHKIVSSKDILFKILSQGFSSRFFTNHTLDYYYDKYISSKV